MSGLGAGERGYPDRPSAPITLTLTLSHRGRGDSPFRPAPGIPCEHRCACSPPLRKVVRRGGRLLCLIDGFSGLIHLVSEVGVLDGGVVD